MRCTRCGGINRGNAKFCKWCGLPQKKRASSVTIVVTFIIAAILIIAAGIAAWMFFSNYSVKGSEEADKEEEQIKNDELLVEWVEKNLKKTAPPNYSDEKIAYTFKDASAIPKANGYAQYNPDYSVILGFQVVDVNFDGKKELMLWCDDESPNCAFICYVEDDEVQTTPMFVIDNQGESFAEYGKALIVYQKRDGNKKRAFISGADGTGAGNYCFTYEVGRDMDVKELYFYNTDYSTESQNYIKEKHMVNGRTVTEEEYEQSVDQLCEEYECIETYDYINIQNDLPEELRIVLGLVKYNEPETEEWKAAYENFLKNYNTSDSDVDPTCFGFGYIDEDDIPELFITDGTYHMCEVHVYTYYAGKVCSLGEFGSNGYFCYAEHKNWVQSYYGGWGSEYTTYYSVRYGSVQTELMLRSSMDEVQTDGEFLTHYWCNNREVDEAAYFKACQDAENRRGFVTSGYDQYIVINDANISSVIQAFSDNEVSDGQTGSTNQSPFASPIPLETPDSTNQPVSTDEPDNNVQYTGSTQLTIISAQASSQLPEQYGYTYEAEHVLDNNTQTAWAEGVPGNGCGEWIQVNLEREQVVSAIEIINGYAKSQSLYQKNARAKRVKLEFSDGSSQEIELQDGQMTSQKQSITPVSSSYVKITILEVYAGSKYEDLCIGHIACYQ